MRGVSGGACTCVQAFCPPSFVARAALFSRFYRIAVSGSSANCFLRESCTRERERERAPPPPPRVLDTITSTFHGITMPRLWRSRVFVASPLLFVPFRPQPLTNFRANGGSQGNGEKRLRSSGNGNCFEELFVIVRNGRMRGSMMMRRGGVSSVEKLNNAILSTILIYISLTFYFGKILICS